MLIEEASAWRSPSQDTMLLRKGRPMSGSDPDLELGLPADGSAAFTLRGRRIIAQLTKSGITLDEAPTRWALLRQARLPEHIAFSEIISAATSKHRTIWRGCCSLPWRGTLQARHGVNIYTFRRSRGRAYHWIPVTWRLVCQDEDVAKQWAADITEAVSAISCRPKTLLVIVNPWGGNGRANKAWSRHAFPIFTQAGVRCVLVETRHPAHAKELVAALPVHELELYDGILAVGGDGLFQEVLDGIAALRCGGDERKAAAAAQLRLGHIPGGSTDAAAYSMHGTRSAATAALHAALGDSTPLDVMRVDTGDGSHRMSVCYATYGYMGDLLYLSEAMRWLGEKRYPLAGAITLFRGRSYRARVSYVASASDSQKMSTCQHQCQRCSMSAGAGCANLAQHSAASIEEETWTTIEGDFKSIMAIVTSCRSDMSPQGLSRNAHLADGRMHLVLVHKCSILQYLKFLSLIPTCGINVEHLPYVRVVEATAVKVQPIGRESHWNVDGELMPHKQLSARVCQAAVQVFSRGVENNT
ncbi:g4561 [Coccomyxa viridis]|uniref:G4561 protein n=1 Tax=Coccomyxa viridis TaxID=1274662 RepID=A0ABP1FQL5_9CHLO